MPRHMVSINTKPSSVIIVKIFYRYLSIQAYQALQEAEVAGPGPYLEPWSATPEYCRALVSSL